MASFVETMLVSLGFDTKDIDNQIGGIAGKLKGIASSIAAPLAGLFTVSALAGSFNAIVQEADALGKLSDRLAVNIEDMQAWGRAAKLSGGSLEAFQGTIQGLTTNLTRIDTLGKSRLTPFFEQLGISAKGADGKVKGAFDVIKELSGKIEGMDRKKATGLLQSIGIDQGTITLLLSGKKSVEELVEEMRSIGVYTREDAKIFEEFNDQTDKVQWSVKMALLPVFKVVAEALTVVGKGVQAATKFWQEHKIVLYPLLIGLGALLMKLLIPAVGALAVKVWAVLAPLLPFIAALVALGIVLEDFIVWLNGGNSAFDEFFESIFGSREVVWAMVDDLIAECKRLWEYFKTFWPHFKKLAMGAFEMIGGGIKVLIGYVRMLKNSFELLYDILSYLCNIFFGTAEGASQAFADIETDMKDFSDTAKSIVEGVKGFFGGLWDFLSGGSKIIENLIPDSILKYFGGVPLPSGEAAAISGGGRGGTVNNIDSDTKNDVKVYVSGGDVGNKVVGAIEKYTGAEANFEVASTYGVA